MLHHLSAKFLVLIAAAYFRLARGGPRVLYMPGLAGIDSDTKHGSISSSLITQPVFIRHSARRLRLVAPTEDLLPQMYVTVAHGQSLFFHELKSNIELTFGFVPKDSATVGLVPFIDSSSCDYGNRDTSRSSNRDPCFFLQELSEGGGSSRARQERASEDNEKEPHRLIRHTIHLHGPLRTHTSSSSATNDERETTQTHPSIFHTSTRPIIVEPSSQAQPEKNSRRVISLRLVPEHSRKESAKTPVTAVKSTTIVAEPKAKDLDDKEKENQFADAEDSAENERAFGAKDYRGDPVIRYERTIRLEPVRQAQHAMLVASKYDDENADHAPTFTESPVRIHHRLPYTATEIPSGNDRDKRHSRNSRLRSRRSDERQRERDRTMQEKKHENLIVSDSDITEEANMLLKIRVVDENSKHFQLVDSMGMCLNHHAGSFLMSVCVKGSKDQVFGLLWGYEVIEMLHEERLKQRRKGATTRLISDDGLEKESRRKSRRGHYHRRGADDTVYGAERDKRESERGEEAMNIVKTTRHSAKRNERERNKARNRASRDRRSTVVSKKRNKIRTESGYDSDTGDELNTERKEKEESCDKADVETFEEDPGDDEHGNLLAGRAEESKEEESKEGADAPFGRRKTGSKRIKKIKRKDKRRRKEKEKTMPHLWQKDVSRDKTQNTGDMLPISLESLLCGSHAPLSSVYDNLLVNTGKVGDEDKLTGSKTDYSKLFDWNKPNKEKTSIKNAIKASAKDDMSSNRKMIIPGKEVLDLLLKEKEKGKHAVNNSDSQAFGKWDAKRYSTDRRKNKTKIETDKALNAAIDCGYGNMSETRMDKCDRKNHETLDKDMTDNLLNELNGSNYKDITANLDKELLESVSKAKKNLKRDELKDSVEMKKKPEYSAIKQSPVPPRASIATVTNKNPMVLRVTTPVRSSIAPSTLASNGIQSGPAGYSAISSTQRLINNPSSATNNSLLLGHNTEPVNVLGNSQGSKSASNMIARLSNSQSSDHEKIKGDDYSLDWFDKKKEESSKKSTSKKEKDYSLDWFSSESSKTKKCQDLLLGKKVAPAVNIAGSAPLGQCQVMGVFNCRSNVPSTIAANRVTTPMVNQAPSFPVAPPVQAMQPLPASMARAAMPVVPNTNTSLLPPTLTDPLAIPDFPSPNSFPETESNGNMMPRQPEELLQLLGKNLLSGQV